MKRVYHVKCDVCGNDACLQFTDSEFNGELQVLTVCRTCMKALSECMYQGIQEATHADE